MKLLAIFSFRKNQHLRFFFADFFVDFFFVAFFADFFFFAGIF